MTQPEYDDLWPDGPRFVRSGAGFALGTDSVLLADFCSLRPGERAIELGCGQGQPDEHARQGPRQLAVARRCKEADPRAGR